MCPNSSTRRFGNTVIATHTAVCRREVTQVEVTQVEVTQVEQDRQRRRLVVYAEVQQLLGEQLDGGGLTHADIAEQ
ncbi:MAG: hypothetical protein ACRDTH_04295 [Pseudonocardiaceae bacterium]